MLSELRRSVREHPLHGFPNHHNGSGVSGAPCVVLHLKQSLIRMLPCTVPGWSVRSVPRALIRRSQCWHVAWRQVCSASQGCFVSVVMVVMLVFRSRGLLGSRWFGMLGKRVYWWSSRHTSHTV